MTTVFKNRSTANLENYRPLASGEQHHESKNYKAYWGLSLAERKSTWVLQREILSYHSANPLIKFHIWRLISRLKCYGIRGQLATESGIKWSVHSRETSSSMNKMCKFHLWECCLAKQGRTKQSFYFKHRSSYISLSLDLDLSARSAYRVMISISTVLSLIF